MVYVFSNVDPGERVIWHSSGRESRRDCGVTGYLQKI